MSLSHLGRSGAWWGAAGCLQLLFKPWQQSSISVSQQEMEGAKLSRAQKRRAQSKKPILPTPEETAAGAEPGTRHAILN